MLDMPPMGGELEGVLAAETVLGACTDCESMLDQRCKWMLGKLTISSTWWTSC